MILTAVLLHLTVSCRSVDPLRSAAIPKEEMDQLKSSRQRWEKWKSAHENSYSYWENYTVVPSAESVEKVTHVRNGIPFAVQSCVHDRDEGSHPGEGSLKSAFALDQFYDDCEQKTLVDAARFNKPATLEFSPEGILKACYFWPPENCADCGFEGFEISAVTALDREYPTMPPCFPPITIYFHGQRSTLSAKDKDQLKEVAKYLRADKHGLYIIAGHAFGGGPGERNLILGEQRANATKSFLVALGIDAKQLYVISYGAEKPVAKPGRRSELNQRVELSRSSQ